MYEIFARLLQERGLTAYKVAKDTGISQATLSDWKRGRCTPKADKLQLLADYFGVPLSYLMGKEKEPERPVSTLDDLKFALFGGEQEITDEMFEEVKTFAQFVKEKYKKK